MFGIMAALTAKLKLPNVQTPQPRRTIPDPKPSESTSPPRLPTCLRDSLAPSGVRLNVAANSRDTEPNKPATQRPSEPRNAKQIPKSLWGRIEHFNAAFEPQNKLQITF